MLSLGIKKLPLLAAVTLILISLSFAGCANKDGNTEVDPVDTPAVQNRIPAPVEIRHTVQNRLEIIETNVADDQDSTPDQTFSYQYIQIKGLKDKATEQKINAELVAIYEELKRQDLPLPPYRGIKTRIPQGSEVVQDNVYMYTTGNFNNILSVMITKNTTYAIPDSAGKVEENGKGHYDNAQYVMQCRTLNYDLNTGEEFALNDVFCDDVDYLTKINNYMSDYLSANYAEDEGYYFMGGDIKLVESFKGFSEAPGFVVYPYGISLVLDYSTPQFDTRFTAFTPTVYFSEFGDNIAITERFYDQEVNIYESNDPVVKGLVPEFNSQDVGGNDYYKMGHVNVYTNWRYSSLLPAEIQKLLTEFMKIDEEKIRGINEALKDIPIEEIEKNGSAFYESAVYADSIGKYININASVFSGHLGKYNQLLNYHCFDSTNLEELKLKDLFIEGYDFKPVIINAIRKNLSEMTDSTGAPLTAKYGDDESIEKLYNSIQGFTLSPDALNITLGMSGLPDQEQYPLNLYILYKDFGCENMRIFD